jgi:Family of unknown function (DUF5670)
MLVNLVLTFFSFQSRSFFEQAERAPLRSALMLWTMFIFLVFLWAVGLTRHFGGNTIHILLGLALMVLVLKFWIYRTSFN